MTANIDTHTMAPKLYVHTLRPEWGVGLITSDEPERMRLQFEDGENRTFARGYFKLLEPADAEETDSDLERVLEKLMRAVGVSEARAKIMTRGASSESRPMQLDDQITKFKAEYENGFEDAKWKSDVRGEGAKRRMKRFRDPALADAARIFAKDRMKRLRDEGHSGQLWEGLLSLLKKTDLVTLKTDVKPLENMAPADQAIAVRRLYDLLYGDGSLTSRFNHWVAALSFGDFKPSWALATAIPALVRPDQFLAVKPTTVRRQAKWMAPNLKVGRDPIGRTYRELITMAFAVKTSLELEEQHPRDLVDVADFMSVTLKRSTKK
jgi:hypothetical protein